MNILEDTFYLVLLGPFLSIAAGLCFTAYTMITVGKTMFTVTVSFKLKFTLEGPQIPKRGLKV